MPLTRLATHNGWYALVVSHRGRRHPRRLWLHIHPDRVASIEPDKHPIGTAVTDDADSDRLDRGGPDADSART